MLSAGVFFWCVQYEQQQTCIAHNCSSSNLLRIGLYIYLNIEVMMNYIHGFACLLGIKEQELGSSLRLENGQEKLQNLLCNSHSCLWLEPGQKLENFWGLSWSGIYAQFCLLPQLQPYLIICCFFFLEEFEFLL